MHRGKADNGIDENRAYIVADLVVTHPWAEAEHHVKQQQRESFIECLHIISKSRLHRLGQLKGHDKSRCAKELKGNLDPKKVTGVH